MSVDYIEKFDSATTESVISSSLINELYESRRSINYDTRQSPSSTAVNELFGTLEIVQPTSEQKPAEKIQNVSAVDGDRPESKPESNASNAATANSFEDILFLLLMKYAEKKEKEHKKA